MNESTAQFLLELSYLIGSVTFIMGLKLMGHPDSAKRGNLIGAGGMTLAILATIFLYHPHGDHDLMINKLLIFGGIAIGTVVGWVIAKKVKITAMPQMVSLFNGMGGLCAAVISIIEFRHLNESLSAFQALKDLFSAMGDSGALATNTMTSSIMIQYSIILAGLVIGTVSFAGSMIAFGKLDGRLKDISLPGQQILNIAILLGIVVLSVLAVRGDISGAWPFYSILGLSAVYGVLFVFPIGGADMPVVISVLNSFTGMAAAIGGFLYSNKVMLTGGILVGSAGTILTVLMCKAMNRSLMNVLIGSFGGKSAASAQGGPQGSAKEVLLNDAAVQLNYSQSVVIIPGYGLAVAQAQKICRELDEILEANGVDVKYAIHPVAGRMPGHMNVLLAEAGVPYSKLVDLEEANSLLENADVAVIIGANDVVNPAALDDPSSPIYGMPILNAHKAKNVIVLKRGMAAGYAGIENALFFYPNTRMLFGDAKASLQKLLTEVKSL